MIDNKITANGSYSLQTYPGQTYVFAVSGNFGGGSLAVRWLEGATGTAYAGSPVTAATSLVFVAATTNAELVLSGATAPDLTVSVRLSDGSGGSLGIGSLGTGVVNALAKPVGTAGSVQLYGDNLYPPAIILPDLTGLTAPLNSVGMTNGKLAVGDSLIPGGKIVSPRYFGTRQWTFGTQAKSAAFVKLFGIPISADKFVIGKNFTLQGKILINNVSDFGGISNITNMPFGLSFLSGSTAVWNGNSSIGDNNWNARNFSAISSIMGSNPLIIEFLPTVNFDSEIGFRVNGGDSSKLLMNNQIDYSVTRAGFAPVLYTTGSLGFSKPTAVSGVANELCFMFQVQTSNAGNYAGEKFTVSYDILFDFTN
jgi:hypothetical protein